MENNAQVINISIHMSNQMSNHIKHNLCQWTTQIIEVYLFTKNINFHINFKISFILIIDKI